MYQKNRIDKLHKKIKYRSSPHEFCRDPFHIKHSQTSYLSYQIYFCVLRLSYPDVPFIISLIENVYYPLVIFPHCTSLKKNFKRHTSDTLCLSELPEICLSGHSTDNFIRPFAPPLKTGLTTCLIIISR